MTEPSVPRGLTEDAAREWAALAGPTPDPVPCPPEATAALPEPVRRWLGHAVADGPPLARAVELRMRGEIFLGRWSPFTADQRLSVTGGFVWAATARLLGLPIRGSTDGRPVRGRCAGGVRADSASWR